MVSLFGYWKGASTSLLDITEPKSKINENLHISFMKLLRNGCTTENTICIFESVRETMFGYPITHVGA